MVNTKSPCVRNCCLDEEDICLGCFRSLEEIMQWSESSEERKEQILGNAQGRRKNKQIKLNDRRNHGLGNRK